MSKIGFAVCLMMMTMTMMISRARAETYTVGDDAGWSTVVDYDDWARDKTFLVGDSLIFNYNPNDDSVDEVTRDSYDRCTNNNPISSDKSGSTTIELRTSGWHFFKTNNIEHCKERMKLEINVCDVGVGLNGNTITVCVDL